MATEKILNTRILMKIDTLENWNNSTLKLKEGELAFATVAASAGTGLEEPVVMVKIGEAEEKTFSELKWAFHAKAADVLAACKTEAGLKTFINNVIAEAGIASSDAMEALAGRVTTAEGKITVLEGEMDAVEKQASDNATAIAELQSLVGTDESVSDQILNAINALNLPTTYAAKSLETTVADHVADTVAHVTTADKTKWNGALQASDIAAGSVNGTIAVKGTDVAITGLGSAAFTESTAYDASGAAAQALADAKTYMADNYDAKGSADTAESNAKKYAKDYVDGLAGNYDESGAAAQALVDAKKYTDDEITEWVGDETVGTQISNAISDLDLANTYDAKGAAAAAESAAKSHADSLNTAMNTRVEALEAIDHDHANKAELDKIVEGDKAKWDAMEQNAKDYADGLDEAMDGRVAALEAKFGDGEGNVESQIADAVAAETKLREEADTALDTRVKTIEDDYLIEADKTELQDAIDALEALVGDGNVAERIAAAVKEEADRAKGIEGDLESRLAEVEGDYLKAADKTELQDNIDTVSAAVELLTNGVSAEEVDGVNDLIQYVKDHGTEVTGIKADIKANSDAIDVIEADYLKAADKTELQNQITSNDSDIEALQAAVGTKAEQSDLTALEGRVSTVETKVGTLEGEMTDAKSAIETLESLVGTDESVSTQIDNAVNALKEGQLTTMQGEIDAVEGRVDTLEAASHDHSNKTVLDGISAEQVTAWDSAVQTVTAGTGLTATKTGTDVAIAFDDSVTFIFDCGDSSNV